MARDHHFFFAKKMIPTHAFRSTDQMFRELTGPKREAFLMYLWQEAGQASGPALPHVEPTPQGVIKLEVVGAIKSQGQEVVVLSMPPAKEPNEAMFIALARGPRGKSVFFYERCLNQAMNGVHESEAVLAEVREEGTRSNYGFKPGLDLASFKRHLGEILGISLDGLETSLPPITMEAFMSAPRSGAEGGRAATATTAQGPSAPIGGLR